MKQFKRGETTYLGQLHFRNYDTRFGIKLNDRFFHQYILGQTGTGKTTLMETMIKQDIQNGYGLWLLDPHGDLVQTIRNDIPKWRERDVVYLNIPSIHLKHRYNPLSKVEKDQYSLVTSGILEVLKKLWKGAWGYRLEHILRYILLTLLHQKHSSLVDISTILLNENFRNRCVSNVENPIIKRFWKEEFNRYSSRDTIPILNKIGAFIVNPSLNRFLISNTNDIDLRQLMDSRKVVLVNLSKGHLGEDISHIIGSLLITSLASNAFSRVDTIEKERVPCFIYADEFQNFSNMTLITMLSELRKYKLGMIMGHQYMAQLDSGISSAVIGNVGTVITFRIGTHDARFMESVMYPDIRTEDLINLENRHIYVKLMIDGKPSKPFSAKTLKYHDVKELTNNLWMI